jgi:zinc and cadmium transporter
MPAATTEEDIAIYAVVYHGEKRLHCEDVDLMNGQVTLWQVVAAYVFALAGGSISTSLHLAHKPLCALISFAAGTLLGVTLFAILPESLGDSPWWAIALAAATGYVLFFFISKYVHHVCPACAASHFDADATRHFSEIATALIVALAIHSTTDGLALGIQQEAPATDATKWSLFAALCIHKVPEGLALGSLLIGAGLQRSGALGWVASVEATTLLGGVIGYFFLAKVSTFWLGLIMAHVGGGFFYLAVHAVLGELIKHGKALVLTSFSAGLALIGILNICLRMLAP